MLSPFVSCKHPLCSPIFSSLTSSFFLPLTPLSLSPHLYLITHSSSAHAHQREGVIRVLQARNTDAASESLHRSLSSADDLSQLSTPNFDPTTPYRTLSVPSITNPSLPFQPGATRAGDSAVTQAGDGLESIYRCVELRTFIRDLQMLIAFSQDGPR